MALQGSCVYRPRVSKARWSVGEIARTHSAALRDSCALSSEQLVVLRALERCRTAALGGHLYECDGCGHIVPMYNSCRNRHCPTCQNLEQRKWLERREDAILPCPYFHVVFTLPNELRPIAAANREAIYTLLFECASTTLTLLCADPKRLGAMPAITLVLHTWSRQLVLHPHVHAIVSAGGLTQDGHWKACREDYLFPVNVMKRLFRRLFRERLLVAIDSGAVHVAPEHNEAMRTALFQKKWVVYAKAPFGGARQVFAYLGRYTHRVGLSNARLMHVDDKCVTFATKNGRSCSLAPVEFLRRFLLHVLPSGFHKIRHYGLSSGTHIARGTLERARAQLVGKEQQALAAPSLMDGAVSSAVPGAAKTPETWAQQLLALTGVDVRVCPRCALGRMHARALPLVVGAPPIEDSS